MELDRVFWLRECGFGLDTVVWVRGLVVMGNAPSVESASLQRSWPVLRYLGSSGVTPTKGVCACRVNPCRQVEMLPRSSLASSHL